MNVENGWVKRIGLLLLSVLVIGIMSACSSGAQTAAAVEPTAAVDRSDTTATGDDIPEFAITVADDGTIQVPAEVPSGIVAFTGLDELAENQNFVQVNDGVTMDELKAVLATANDDPTEALTKVSLMGGMPGDDGRVVFDLKPGATYAVVDIPDDAPPTVAEIKTGAPSGATAPTTDVNVELVDFAFNMPTEIKSGPQTWQVTNTGTQWHEMSIVKLNEGATIDDVMAMIMSEDEPSGPPPFEDVAFWGLTSPGETAWANWDLPPGNYTVLCFLPDLNGDFSPHATHGMVAQLTVTP